MFNCRIKLNMPIILALFLPYIFPAGLIHLVPTLDDVIESWVLLSTIVILFFYIVSEKGSKVIFVIAMYAFATLLSTFINGGDYWAFAVSYGKTIALCMLIELCIGRNTKTLIVVMSYSLGIAVLINLYTVLRFPTGMYVTTFFRENWLLDYDNVHFNYIFPLLCISMIYAEYKKLSFHTKLILILLFSASIYITWSVASVVAITAWIVLWLVMERWDNLRLLNIYRVIAVHGGIFLGIVIIRIQDLFKWLIVDFLGKDLTFSGRTQRWDKALRMISERPIFGWGYLGTDEMRIKLNGFSHCHNHFLQVLFQSGIVGMLCFVAVLIVLIEPLSCVRNRKYTAIIVNTLFCFLLVGQIEALTNMTTYFAIITIAYHAPEIEKGLESAERHMGLRVVWGKNDTHTKNQ